MQLTKHTLTRDILPILDEKRITDILEIIPVGKMDKHIIEMTVGEFVEAMNPAYAIKMISKKRKALDALGWLKAFRNEMNGIKRYIEKCQPPQDDDSNKASIGINFPNPQERILLDVTKTFGLKRIEGKFLRYGATDVPLAEYLMTLKDSAASAKYQYNLNKIQNDKINGRR